MFHRKRATSNPPRVVKNPPSQAASLAATQAFLANRASNGELSAAAAAAALRSHTTSPIPLGQIQTKRMQRRGSVSSNGSAPDRPGLLRRTSSGSMTERTFRDPSPSRPASSHGPYTRNDEPPPVPALPKNIPQAPQPMSAQRKAARRAASVEPMERVSSPAPRLHAGRGVSLDRGPGNSRPDQRAANARLTNLNTVGELERPGSRNSVNFSRPMSPQNSPPASPLGGGRVRSPPPSKSNGVNGLPSREVDRIMESIQETAAAPVKKKNKAAAKGSAEGSHLVAGTVNDQSQAASVQENRSRQLPSVSSGTSQSTVTMPSGANELPRPKRKKTKPRQAVDSHVSEQEEGFGSAYPSDTDSVTSERSSTNEKPRAYATRAAGLLMKQPSIVREDREAEEQEERRLPAKTMNGQIPHSSTSGAATPANTSKVVSKSAQHNRAASQTDTPKTAQQASLNVPNAVRQQSLSPARSTHFLSQPQYENADGVKHQPPERSVSPAKSALKHSPSRGSSDSRRIGFAASEASDTASNISDEGYRSVPKKKKSVRVSFDDDSVSVGRAASPPMSSDSPIVMSPQNKPKSRSWLDLVRENKQEEAITYRGSVMKPTPTLPSFGSIRRDRDDEPVLNSAKDQRSSEEWAQDTLRTMDTSSDQAAGSIIAQDAVVEPKDAETPSSKGNSEPSPPKVTSVEGTGVGSKEVNDTFEDAQQQEMQSQGHGIVQEPKASLPMNEAPSLEPTSESRLARELDPSVPSIALQPATPGLETSGVEQSGWLGMPGGFPDASESSQTPQPQPTSVIEHHSPEVRPTPIGLAEPEAAAVPTQQDLRSLHGGGLANVLQTQTEPHSEEESDDSGNSIYSDAAEDPDDVDGDGFGSINAMIESPAPSPRDHAAPSVLLAGANSNALAAKKTKPGVLTRNESELSEPAAEEGWDRAQAYWSGLSQERKRQLEHAAVPGALDGRVLPNKTMRGPESVKKKTKKVVTKTVDTPPGSHNPPMPPWPDKEYRNDITKSTQSTAPTIKSSLRNTQAKDTQESRMPSSMRKSQVADRAPEIYMRSSMRDGPLPKSSLKNVSQRSSVQLPASETKGALQKKNRPTSAVAMVDYNKPQAALKSGHTRASSAGVPPNSLTPVLAQSKKKVPAPKPTLRRNDSDSSSSFKKERSTTSAASGKYTMKRTMRPSSVDARASTNRASSMDRTASPVGSVARRPFSSVGPGGGGMRTSMRESIDTSKPAPRTSLRESMDSKRAKSPSRFGFGKPSKPKAVDSKPSSRFSSRFGDSSDEGDSRPARRSRFADSSDDEPADLTPVRGIPRRIDEGDSTDLEDSSVENTPVPTKSKVNSSAAAADMKPEGLALASGSLHGASGDGQTAAMGSGLHAKKADEKDKDKKKRSFFGGLGSKKLDDPSRVRKADIESSARRDTPLERSKAERALATGAPKSERVLESSSPKADPVVKAARPGLGSPAVSAQNSPKSPKLQRRNTPKRLTSANDISWPLPQSPGGTMGTSDSRPRTSDGAVVSNGTGRPHLGVRRTTVQDPHPPTAPLVIGKTEKKKRFGMLRKALGMQN